MIATPLGKLFLKNGTTVETELLCIALPAPRTSPNHKQYIPNHSRKTQYHTIHILNHN